MIRKDKITDKASDDRLEKTSSESSETCTARDLEDRAISAFSDIEGSEDK